MTETTERGKMILVIDDEEMIRNLAGKILQKGGYKVSFAENGQDGIDLVKAAPEDYELVICDMFMDGISGVETITAIHQFKPEIKFIMSSGNEITADDIPAELVAQTSFLMKPYRSKLLTEMVNNLLNPVTA